MRSYADAMARGASLRLQTLRLEGLTEDAVRIAERVSGMVTENPVDNSPEAALLHRFNFNYAGLLLRDGRTESIEKAKELVHSSYERLSFQAEAQGQPLALEGQRRLALLMNIALFFNRIGEHRKAAALLERLLDRAEGASPRQGSRIALQFNNLAEVWLAAGFAESCADHFESAQSCYEKAAGYAERLQRHGVTHLSDTSQETQDGARLMWISNSISTETAQIELALEHRGLQPDHCEQLERLREAARQLVRESNANPTVTPRQMTFRYERLGSVYLQIARFQAATGAGDAIANAVRARVFLAHRYDCHVRDADEPALLVFRYADACRVGGDSERAAQALTRGLERLRIRCGSGYPPCAVLAGRLEALGS